MASAKRVETLKLFCTSSLQVAGAKRKMQGQNWKGCGVLVKAKADVKSYE